MEGRIQITLKEKLEERKITRCALSRRTGLLYKTINGYYNNTVTRFESETLICLCKALDCEVGDLIQIVKEET